MKVLAINGSPNSDGNTAQTLKMLLQEVKDAGIETELITIGNKDIRGCICCRRCAEKKDGRCAAFNDTVNELMPKMIEADGIVLGSPVYFAGINGTLKSFLDRAFFVSLVNGNPLRLKAGAAVVALRRSGGTAAIDALNKYFQISEITVASSCYWNAIHGLLPGEISQDMEGVNVIRKLGRNLAWLLKIAEYSKEHVPLPKIENPVQTNFVR